MTIKTHTAPVITTSNFITLFEVLSDTLMFKHGRTKSSNKVAPKEFSVLDMVLKTEGHLVGIILRGLLAERRIS